MRKDIVFGIFCVIGGLASMMGDTLAVAISSLFGKQTVASLSTLFPAFITISQYQDWIFLGAGILLLCAAISFKNQKHAVHSAAKTLWALTLIFLLTTVTIRHILPRILY